MAKKEEKSWYEREDFWTALSPILFGRSRIAATNEEVERIVSLLGLQAGSTVCDLCCGVGRHSVELARRQFCVTGVDRNLDYIETARRRGAAMGVDIEFVHEDMRSFWRSDCFDAVINMFTSFGYFEEPSDDIRVVENVYKSLKHDGKFLMELMGKEILARTFRERDWVQEDDVIVLEERKVIKNWSAIENRWTVVKDGTHREYKFTHRLYSAVELSDVLKCCGFQRVDVCGDLAGAPYDEKAVRLVLVGYK